MYSFPRVMSRGEALQIAENKGGKLWRLVFSGMPLSKLQLYYFEHKLIKLEVSIEQPFFSKLFSNKNNKPKRMKVTILGNGTTGSVAIVDNHPDILSVEVAGDEKVQYAYCQEERLITNARKLCTRVLHRMRGGIPCVESVEIESVFRPYWVAFYGNYELGNKVRYKAIPADGCSSQRTF